MNKIRMIYKMIMNNVKCATLFIIHHSAFCIFLHSSFILTAQPPISKEKFHLYLLAGQSNMAGRGTIAQEDTITNLRIWVLNKNNEWTLAKEPLHFDKPSLVGVGLGFTFAKEMANADTNIVIGLIPCAVGGSSIDVWEVGKYHEPTKNYPYDDAIRRTKIAMQSGTLKGILWQQGESDSDSTKAIVYHKKLKSLVKHFRKDLKIKRLAFVAGKIPDFYIQKHPFAKDVNKAIEDLPNRVKHTAFVETKDLTHKGDAVHFDSPSARELGKRFAKTFLNDECRMINDE